MPDLNDFEEFTAAWIDCRREVHVGAPIDLADHLGLIDSQSEGTAGGAVAAKSSQRVCLRRLKSWQADKSKLELAPSRIRGHTSALFEDAEPNEREAS
jgi:hypothetical protein